MIKETVFTAIQGNVNERIKNVTKDMIDEVTVNGIQVTSPEFSEVNTAKLFALQNVHYILDTIKEYDDTEEDYDDTEEDEENGVYDVVTSKVSELVDLLVSDTFQIKYFADKISDVQDMDWYFSFLERLEEIDDED